MSTAVSEKEIFDGVVSIVGPHAKNAEALAKVNNETTILKDLGVNSARLVDVIIQMEDKFSIEVTDEDAEKVMTIGDAVSIIKSKI